LLDDALQATPELFENSILITGCARGVDKFSEEWYRLKIGSNVQRFPAEWGKYGRAAGHVRNKAMAKEADFLIAIWNGSSLGTKGMIELMKKENKPYVVFT